MANVLFESAANPPETGNRSPAPNADPGFWFGGPKLIHDSQGLHFRPSPGIPLRPLFCYSCRPATCGIKIRPIIHATQGANKIFVTY